MSQEELEQIKIRVKQKHAKKICKVLSKCELIKQLECDSVDYIVDRIEGVGKLYHG